MTYPYFRPMHNGFFAVLDDDVRGTYKLARCSWLIEVPSGNPEPDCYADTIKVVDCGGRLVQADDNGWRCEHGHGLRDYRNGGADDEFFREQEERMRY